MKFASAQRAIGLFVEAAPTLAMLALLMLAGWLGAQWFLYFTTHGDASPPPERQRVQLGAAAEGLASTHLFGVAPTGAGGEVVSNLNIKLKGVFASGADAPSMAILNTGDRDQTARVGGEVAPGILLEAVHPEYVMLRRNGSLERVNLEERQETAVAARAPPRRAASSRSPARQPQTPPAPRAAAQGPPGGSQGLVIPNIPPGSMLERLGLQPGDVIRTVNGEAVRSEADVARIVQQQGLQGTFTAEVQRGGMTIPIAVNPQR